ncbi:MAG: hypothetical protein EBR88_07240 [Betaproteobacteria bacterium]|nr:hypothetical protein [Betaproteobacteria bacterium]
MGLVPVWEVRLEAGCPVVYAAPSPQWYEFDYRSCDGQDFARFQGGSLDKLHINNFLRNLCNQNLERQNGCMVEVHVIDTHDYAHPIYPR